ncbi:anti-sigma factor [Sphingomonas montana]|uniref:anti-sigma factor n=1 Tax=Sphingomonas montana TaxID=1843236 RepID=UPI00096E0516|nr:anti-sigma factor [Sphingomonas montana]
MTEPMDMTAAEYVLGTLDPAERAAFEAVLRDDPQAVAAVATWQRRLAVLDAVAPDMMPSAELWHRIEAATRPQPANDNRVARGWRSMAVAAALIATVSSGLAVVGWQRPDAKPMDAVATLTPEGATPAVLVGWHDDSGRYEVRPVSMEADRVHAHQLWLIVEGAGPRSMGLIGNEARWIDGRSLRPGQAATIAVSVEPIGGSPTGAPTGPVIYSGKLVRLPQNA